LIVSFFKRFYESLFNNSSPTLEFHESLESFLIQGLKLPISNLNFYKQAFTHTSKIKKRRESFERLEFLGDAILGAVVAERVYQEFPEDQEGELSKHRSKIVSRKSLNTIGQNLGLVTYIIASKQGKMAKSLSGNALESLIGAIYIDLGWTESVKFINNHVLSQIDFHNLAQEIISYKSQIMELAAKQKLKISFTLLSESGFDHEKIYEIGFCLNDEIIAKANSGSKKKAEEKVAKMVYEQGIIQLKSS